MRKSSKATGTKPKISKSIPINDQVIDKKKEIEEKSIIHVGLNRIKFFLREIVEIERLVTKPIPFASYDLKTEIVDSFLEHKNKQPISDDLLISFKNKVQELMDEHPPTSRDSVDSYINKHQYYIPTEFAFLMRQKGKLDIKDSTIEEIEESIYGILHIDSFLEDLLFNECKAQNIDDRQLTIEKQQYSPKLIWKGDYSHFSGLMVSMIKNGWIEAPSKSLDKNAEYFKYHFAIFLKKVEVKKRTLSKSMGDFTRDVVDIDDIRQKKLDTSIYPFTPAGLPKK